MWSFSQKKKFRTKGFQKKIEFKNLFQSERGYEDYITTKPRLYQPVVTKTKKGKRQDANSQKGNNSRNGNE